jgi:polyphenol oxidase
MKQTSINGLDLWQFEALSRQTSIQHFVTDRSSGTHDSEFTLSLSSSPDRAMVLRNRSLLASAMGIHNSELYFPSQVHKTRILQVTRSTVNEELLETDALLTNEPKICIAVMSADCVPILLFDRKNFAVGAVHSGWRGTVARILEKSLHEMNRIFGTRGEDIYAAIGPSVSMDSYEVGEEVVQEVTRSFNISDQLLTATENKKAKLDLWKANQIQLLEFGVSRDRIEISNLCTVQHNHHFFSARKGDKGRFAAGIMLRRAQDHKD